MNLIKCMLIAVIFIATHSRAEEKSTEVLIDAIEVSHLMVNWSPNGSNLGRVIMARCPECPPEIMTFNQSTELFINEQARPISDLATKTDWSGVISVTNQAPTEIIRIRIY